MKELNWPKHLAATPAARGRRGLAVAGIAILLAAIGFTAWFADGSFSKPQVAVPAPAPTEPAATQVAVIVPAAEEPPPLSAAEVTKSAPTVEAPKTEPAKAAIPAAMPTDWATVAQDELKSRAEANEILAMEEMARRLIQGIGVPKDQQGGAGWLVRAAQVGSPQSAFNVGVMYERGFVVERDSTRAAEWYRKAAEANVAMARHNLALLLRDGKGSARNVAEAIVLLRAAAKQGMSASMFTLGDIYERGDSGTKDLALALAWFAITAEFERQASKGAETPLIKTSTQRAQALQRTLTPAELEKARVLGQNEFKVIVDALSLSVAPQLKSEPSPPQAAVPAAPPPDAPGWPATNSGDQVRAIQQALFDLKLVRDKPDGAMGPNTRAAIRQFQRSMSMRETGEPTKEIYGALKEMLSRRDTVANSPLPAPPQIAKAEPEKTENKAETKPEAKPEPPKAETKVEPPKPAPAPAGIDSPKPEPPKVVETKPAPPVPEPQINIGMAPPPPPPPTSADIAKSTPKPPPPKPDPDAWPPTTADQIKAVQGLLRELNFYSGKADGQAGSATKSAIREYERASGLKESGEPGKALFDSLKEMRALMKR